MNYIKLPVILFILVILSGCISSIKMNPEKFAELKSENKDLMVFKIDFNYSGNQVDLYPPSKCYIFFSNSNSKGLTRYVSESVKGGNYVFVTPKNPEEEIYLNAIQCMEYRVFYNKNRLKKVKQKISTIEMQNKINYGGDIEIYWTAETFKVSDLFNLGHMGMQDDGSFTMRVNDGYEDYLDFISNKYGAKKEESHNSTDKEILRKVLQR